MRDKLRAKIVGGNSWENYQEGREVSKKKKNYQEGRQLIELLNHGFQISVRKLCAGISC